MNARAPLPIECTVFDIAILQSVFHLVQLWPGEYHYLFYGVKSGLTLTHRQDTVAVVVSTNKIGVSTVVCVSSNHVDLHTGCMMLKMKIEKEKTDIKDGKVWERGRSHRRCNKRASSATYGYGIK